MAVPQEESFLYSPRQNYRNNIGLAENPGRTKVDLPKASFAHKADSNFDSLKRQNVFGGIDRTSHQHQIQLKSPSAGKISRTKEILLIKRN